MGQRERWNKRYANQLQAATASAVLEANRHLLPPQGSALDLACGLGGDAVLLARHGLEVEAWDISDVAIAWLNGFARSQRLAINARRTDITGAELTTQQFDVIVVSHFLDRDLAPALIEALRPSGLLFYQTFHRRKVGNVGPSSPSYLLQANELLRLFAPLEIVYYREEAGYGRGPAAQPNTAQMIAARRE